MVGHESGIARRRLLPWSWLCSGKAGIDDAVAKSLAEDGRICSMICFQEMVI